MPELSELQSFGDTLAHFRERRLVSKARLSRRSGFSPSYVSRLESGARVPTVETVYTLARSLELSCPDRDRLLISAGYLPVEPTAVLRREPDVVAIYDQLRDPTRPETIRDQARSQLRALATILKEVPA